LWFEIPVEKVLGLSFANTTIFENQPSIAEERAVARLTRKFKSMGMRNTSQNNPSLKSLPMALGQPPTSTTISFLLSISLLQVHTASSHLLIRASSTRFSWRV